MLWLLSEDIAREMRKAVSMGLMPTAEQRAAHERRELEAASAAGSVPRGMTIAGDTAEIRIEGVLTPKPDLFALFFGGGNTAYRDIQAALANALADPGIRRVVLAISSPGGTVDGLYETLAALEALKASGKPITVRASQAQSAAYAIAAVAGKIRAETPASMFGSLGVAISFLVEDDVVDIANTESPNKRPDLSTPEGQNVVRQELDALFELFAEVVAKGRGVSVDFVKSEFGRGSSFVAAEAAKRKMIDVAPRLSIVRATDENPAPVATVGDLAAGPVNPPADHGGSKERRNAMTKEELKAQHPELYTAVLKDGETAERDRVCAHLELAEGSGDMKTAHEAIRSGTGITATVTAKHMSAAMNRRDQKDRQSDSDAAATAANGAAAPRTVAKDFGDLVADSMGLPPVPAQ